MKRFSAFLLLAGLLLSSSLQAQNNPFPQNKTYPYGLMPANRSSTDAAAAYSTWKTNFLAPCANGRYRVKFDNGTQTVSEGIGYGMLLSAYAGDKAVFDGLWLFYKDFRNSHGVMHWKIEGCTSVIGSNGATDSEVDAAMALIVANSQWPSTGTINYNADAKTLIAAIKAFEVEAGTQVLKPGDMFGGSNLTNPSYFAPGYFRAFGQFTNDATFWNGVAAKTYQVINANLSKNNAAGGLVSDWTKADGTYSADAGGYVNGGTRYSYDAARTPWRIATDYVWYGTAEAKSYSQKSSDFVRVTLGGPKNIKDGYYQNGTASGQWHNSTFVGAFASAAMGGGNQTHLNDSYADLKGINDASSYFNQTLKALYLYLLTGNFYLPGGAITNPVNTPPTVSVTSPANNATFKAPATINLTATAADANGNVSKVEFYNGTVKLGEDLTSPYTYSWINVAAGTYTITAKATDIGSAVTTSGAKTIIVSGTTTTPTPPGNTPFGGTAVAIPGRVEAERYDLGGSSVAYTDADNENSGASFRTDGVDLEASTDANAGYNIGWTAAGEWLKYSVNVSNAGKYDIKLRVASMSAGKMMALEMNGVNISGNIQVPNTGGWQTWQTVTISGVTLSKGTQVMRVLFNTDGINLNYIDFATALTSNPSNIAPTASITSPAKNTVYPVGTTVNITATARDTDGSITKVEFYRGSVKIGEDLTSPYNLSVAGLSAGAYDLTIRASDNSGGMTVSPAVNISIGSGITPPPTGCQVQTIPPASEFVLRNAWNDNSNGSAISADPAGLKVTHRAWGNPSIFVVQTGKNIAITGGKVYTISFDFKNDAVNQVTSISTGFANGVEGSGPKLAQPLVSVPAGFSSGDFTSKSVKITAAASGSLNLVLNLNWNGQPNANVNTLIKNISVCESGTSTVQSRIAVNNHLTVYPNPFSDQATLMVTSDLTEPMQVEITDVYGSARGSFQSATNTEVKLGNQLPAGNYFLKVSFSGNVLNSSLIKN